MNAMHTKGPWVVEEVTEADGSVTFDIGRVEITAARDVAYIQTISTYSGKQMQEQAANARLVAAAPDLLAALAGILAVASVRIDDPRIEQFDAARAAIKKATQ